MGGFARRRLNGWIPMILSRTDAAIDQVVRTARVTPPGQPIDLYPAGRTMALSVVLEALLGDRMAGRVDEIAPLIERPQAYLESPAIRQIPHPLPRTRRAGVRADRAGTRSHHRRGDRAPSLDARRTERRMCNAMTCWRRWCRPGELSDSEMRDQVVTLIGAGFDTTAAAFSWLLWRAVLLPGLWQRLALEADAPSALATADPADDRTLSQLTLASATVHESLRLHPAGLAGVREAMVDVESCAAIASLARTIVAWSPYLSGRDPAVWPDPLGVRP